VQPTTSSTVLARHGWTVAAALLVAVVYGVSLSIMPKHVFWMPDEGAKLFELEAISLSWTNGVTYRLPFAGQRLIPGNDFLPGFDVFPDPITVSDGRMYLGFDNPIVFPLMTAPFFHTFGPVGLYILPVVSGWLVAVLSGVLATWFSSRLAPSAVLLVGLATPVWFYSVVFWEHTLASLFALLAVCVLVRAPHRIESIAATIPAMLVASMLRAEMPALAVALVVAWVVVVANAWRQPGTSSNDPTVLRLRRLLGDWRLLLLWLVAAVGLGALFRSSLTGRHHALIGVLPERLEQAFWGLPNIPQGLFEVFINSQNLGPAVTMGWRVTAAAAVLLALVAPLIRSRRARAAAVVAALAMILPCSVSLILTGEPYRGLHGLYPVAPFVILWPLALRGAWRRHDARVLALGTATGAYLLLCFGALALTYIHQGQLDVGMQWGQRYLLTAYPMLVVLSLLALRALLRSLPSTWPRAVVAGLFALLVAAGIGLEARGLRMLHGTRSIIANWDEAMRAEGPIVTTVWWIVPAVADLFLTHEMFFTWQPGVAHWVERARQQGVTSFTLAHTEPISDEALNAPGLQRDPDGTRMIAGGLLLTRFRIEPVPGQ
jgi:hypothetical protein